MSADEIKDTGAKEKLQRSITTVIFDMDDLMINSHPVNMDIIEAVLNKYGVSLVGTFTTEEEIGYSGLKIPDYFQRLINKYDLQDNADAKKMSQEFDELILPIIEKTDVEPMPGLITLISALQKGNYRLAVASSAKREKIAIVLRKLELENTFEVVVSGEDDIEHGKPAPDIFLKAAEMLGVTPEECLVLEDAENGVKAAKGAGMYSIGVHNKFNKKKLKMTQNLELADKQVNSLEEISLKTIEELS